MEKKERSMKWRMDIMGTGSGIKNIRSPSWRRFGLENRAFQSKHSVILDIRLHPYKVIHIHTLTSISVCNYMSYGGHASIYTQCKRSTYLLELKNGDGRSKKMELMQTLSWKILVCWCRFDSLSSVPCIKSFKPSFTAYLNKLNRFDNLSVLQSIISQLLLG